jgi:hypothetical protein
MAIVEKWSWAKTIVKLSFFKMPCSFIKPNFFSGQYGPNFTLVHLLEKVQNNLLFIFLAQCQFT